MNSLPAIERQKFLNALSQYIDATVTDDGTLGLLLVDIVNLTQINHAYRFTHGDQALCHCYTRLLSISRLPETVFRVGDRKFVFILPALKNPSFIALALSKVNSVLQEEFVIDNKGVELDIKIGMALNQGAKFSSEETLQAAESSLKKAKISNDSFSLPASENERQQTQVLDKLFEDKLKANDFELYYQPKVNLLTGDIESAEALLRWKLPGEGYISPEIAIEIAEKTGKSFALTKWVMNTAIRQLKDWEKQGLSLSVAVNIPANLIQEPELFTMVKDSLAIWGVIKNQLTLEITESAIIEDKEAGFDNLSKLKDFGVKLSIDDFGTGYSSLSYFKQIPANELKIDKSFVINMLTSSEDQQIVKIIVDIAHVFGLRVVAEGIEDQQTYDHLKELGCDYGQGYHMCRPLPVDEFYKFVQSRKSA